MEMGDDEKLQIYFIFIVINEPLKTVSKVYSLRL